MMMLCRGNDVVQRKRKNTEKKRCGLENGEENAGVATRKGRGGEERVRKVAEKKKKKQTKIRNAV